MEDTLSWEKVPGRWAQLCFPRLQRLPSPSLLAERTGLGVWGGSAHVEGAVAEGKGHCPHHRPSTGWEQGQQGENTRGKDTVKEFVRRSLNSQHSRKASHRLEYEKEVITPVNYFLLNQCQHPRKLFAPGPRRPRVTKRGRKK